MDQHAGCATLDVGERITTISLGDPVGESIAGLDGKAITHLGVDAAAGGDGNDDGGGDDDDDDSSAPRPLGPAWFLISEPIRRWLAIKPRTQRAIVERFEEREPLSVSVHRLLPSLQAAGLIEVRLRYETRSPEDSRFAWALTDEGKRAAFWAGPPMHAGLTLVSYARELAPAVAQMFGVTQHAIYRGATHGPAVIARARFCAALESVGWARSSIARTFGMDPVWVTNGCERWKRLSPALVEARTC